MLPLRDAQARMAKGIFGDRGADDLIVADGIDPARRLAIYRHHYHATLREALALTFPVIFRLVGEGFFNAMVDAFTAAHPPTQPCIAEYGADFPDFIAGFEPAKNLPYLTDVALFEWLVTEAASDTQYQGQAFHSLWPVGRIWRTNQPGYEGDGTVNLGEGGGWFVVERNGDDVQWRMLNLPADTFAQTQGEKR